MPIMTPDEVLCETVDKRTQQLAEPLHNDLTKFGNEKLEALRKLTQILAPTTDVEAPRVEKMDEHIKPNTTDVNKNLVSACPRVKIPTLRVEKVRKK